MCPQPLSRVKPDAYVKWDAAALAERPPLAVWVARTIAAWSQIEARLGNVLTGMLSADAVPVAAMYARIDSAAARSAALEGAAPAALKQEDQGLFLATLRVLRRLGRTRNEFAHWIWGHSDQLPDALLLLDPKDDIQHHAKPPDLNALAGVFRENADALRSDAAGAFDRVSMQLAMQMRMDPALVRVYREPDFEEAHKGAQRADWLSLNLLLLARRKQDELSALGRILLSSAPDVQKAAGKGSARRPIPP